jgi:hypothetical protein
MLSFSPAALWHFSSVKSCYLAGLCVELRKQNGNCEYSGYTFKNYTPAFFSLPSNSRISCSNLACLLSSTEIQAALLLSSLAGDASL